MAAKVKTGEIMNLCCRLLVLILMFFALTILACSKEKSPEKEAGGIKTSTQQAKEEITEYGKRAIDKAKKTQSLGQDRTREIDELTENPVKR